MNVINNSIYNLLLNVCTICKGYRCSSTCRSIWRLAIRGLPPYDSCLITEYSNSGSVWGLFQPPCQHSLWNETETPAALTAWLFLDISAKCSQQRESCKPTISEGLKTLALRVTAAPVVNRILIKIWFYANVFLICDLWKKRNFLLGEANDEHFLSWQYMHLSQQ